MTLLKHARLNLDWVTIPHTESGVLPDADVLSRLREVESITGQPVRMTIETLSDAKVLYTLEEKE